MTGTPHYTDEEIADAKVLYLGLLSQGFTERDMDQVEKLPGHTYRSAWKEDKTFAEQCQRARADGASYVLHSAEEKLKHAWDKADDDSCSPQMATLAESFMRHARWRASKYNPDLYGEKVKNEHTGKNGGPIQTTVAVSAEEAKIISDALDEEF